MTTNPFLVLISIIVCGWISLSCDCIMTPIEKHIQDTEFIVEGTIVELLDTENERQEYVSSMKECSYRVKLRLLKCYKGGLKKGQILLIDSDFTNCSLCFNLGGNYLLFLTNSEDKIEFRQRTCSYNEKLEKAGKYVKAIKKLT